MDKKYEMLIKKTPDVIGLMVTTVFNKNIGADENKIPDMSGSVTNAVNDAKIGMKLRIKYLMLVI